METLPKRTVVETLSASEDYSRHLELLLNSVLSAESQVHTSALSASKQVETTFKTLSTTILLVIENRKSVLLNDIKKAQENASLPLRQCRIEIAEKLTKNKQLEVEAKSVLKSGGFKSPEKCNQFINQCSAMGALPAVPEVELVPNITFQAAVSDILPEIEELIYNFGRVYKIGPVQITSIVPKPGALLIQWEDVDFDAVFDDQSYRLQMCVGQHQEGKDLADVYIGHETHFLVTNLKHNADYSFRVCCNVTGSTEWSSWSLAKTASTNICPYNWNTNNPSYCVSDDNRLARAITPDSILFSSSAQITKGYSINFTLLSQVEPLADEGVALTVSSLLSTGSLAQPGAFFVSFCGDVYIDGVKKIISLPKMEKGSKIVFSCDIVNTKWRVTVERGSKAVTYEWATNTHHLFFATSLSQPDVQVLVE